MPIAVGIDLVGYEEIAETLRRGDRYLRRIYTDEELDSCGASPRLLAACFAAKEATMTATEANRKTAPPVPGTKQTDPKPKPPEPAPAPKGGHP